MRRWLARLAFSFILIGCVLAWEARKAATAGRRQLYAAAAVVAFGLGAVGVRERHRIQ